ncbi:MAG: UPF0175 family protein [Balneolales bacterium]
MRELILNIPDAVDLGDKEASMILAAKLYDQGRLSLGQAAACAGLDKGKIWLKSKD